MPSVLFVCTGNQYRSPIAAAAFRRQLNDRESAEQWIVASAGTWTDPGLPPFPDSVRVAQDLGLNIMDHTTRTVTADELAKYDLVLVMEQGHKEAIMREFSLTCRKLHLLSEVVDHIEYDISDPANAYVDAKEIAIEVCGLIQRGFSQICALAEANCLDKAPVL
jgi:protein-tyrosine phosphatase